VEYLSYRLTTAKNAPRSACSLLRLRHDDEKKLSRVVGVHPGA
jgi:hypothetical protein